MLNIDYERRIFGLDVLRSFAIVAVLYNHGWVYSEKLLSRETYDIFHFDGVSLFFVLSGFLIGGIIIKIIENQAVDIHTLKDFWLRRWFRTLPLYYLILTFLTLQMVYYSSFLSAFRNTARFYFFLQNMWTLKGLFFLQSWSLAVEEWFYILIPMAVWVLVGKLKVPLKNALWGIFVFIVLMSFCMRLYKFNSYELLILSGNSVPERFTFTVLCRLDSLVFGVIGAYFFHFKNKMWLQYSKRMFVIGIGIILIDYGLYNPQFFSSMSKTAFFYQYKYVFHYTILPMATTMILPYISLIRFPNTVFSKMITITSVISYSLYLIHLSIVVNLGIPEKLSRLLGYPPPISFVIEYLSYWVVSFVVSVLMYSYFERPCTNLREKFTSK